MQALKPHLGKQKTTSTERNPFAQQPADAVSNADRSRIRQLERELRQKYVLTGTLTGQVDASKATIAHLEELIEQLQGTLDNANRPSASNERVKDLGGKNQRLEAALRDTQQNIKTVTEEIDELAQQNASNARIKELEAKGEHLEKGTNILSRGLGLSPNEIRSGPSRTLSL